MKYTIEGFNQRNAISMGLNSEDLVLLRWFVDFKNTNDMKKIYLNEVNDMGYWVSYSYLIQELPILFSLHPSQTLEDYNSLTAKEKMDLDKKYIKACKQKIKRMLSGNLSKVLLRNKSTERNSDGKVKSDIYIHLNPTVFKLLISDDITEVQKCTTATEVQKCTTVTEVQKCTIYPSTINTYPSTTTSKKKSKDFSSDNKNENIVLIESKTHLKLDSKYKINKVSKWDIERLTKAIGIFIEKEGQYFSLLEKIYKDDKNFVPKKDNQPNSKLDEYNNRCNMVIEVGGKLINTKELGEDLNRLVEERNSNGNQLGNLVKNCIESEFYYNDLSPRTKENVTKYILENYKEVPTWIR
ncbi:hypothetical protein PN398_06640 [Romboutsia sp. 1001216sp1]|uniref:hypothetical protein n=1 Tax=Romboutsia sp. 1001216sp1 TaxID=2986997 RepID=UPI00232DF32C|nr:hypothetical protein [Romboutsia sp. 1001216sp1]MDB8790391.1 hypothetical protein [Romboutsia sp. 1001216sp1]